MNAQQQSEQPRPSRGTVIAMPRRGPQPQSPGTAPTAPPGHDHDPGDEPGYGHGV